MRPTIDLAAAVAACDQHQAAPLTLRELVHAFNTRNLGDDDWRLRKWLDAFGDMNAWELSSELLENAAQAMLKAGYQPSTVNRDLSTLGTCYRWAHRQRLCPRGFRSPTLGVRRYTEAIRRVEVSEETIAALRAKSLAVRDLRFGVFVHLLVDSGARKSELLERRWKEFDLEQGQVLCPTTKTGVPRVLHFQPATADLIRRRCKGLKPEDLVFEGRVPGQPISYKAAWRALTRDVGAPDLHLHDLRHAAAARLLRAGVTLGVAAQVLGHDPAVLARRYGHLEIGALRAAQEQAWQGAGVTILKPQRDTIVNVCEAP
jgi:integrase